MPRFHFNTEDGEIVCDPDGEVLADDAAARREAVKLMGSILRDSPEDFLNHRRWRMIVAEDERGDIFTVEVSMEIGAAISDWGDPAARTGPAAH